VVSLLDEIRVPGSKAAGIAMAFEPFEAARERWRAVSAPHLVALVRAGARFERGKLAERDPALQATQAADDTSVSRPPPRNNPSATPRNDLHPLPGRWHDHSVRLLRTTSRSS